MTVDERAVVDVDRARDTDVARGGANRIEIAVALHVVTTANVHLARGPTPHIETVGNDRLLCALQIEPRLTTTCSDRQHSIAVEGELRLIAERHRRPRTCRPADRHHVHLELRCVAERHFRSMERELLRLLSRILLKVEHGIPRGA